MLDEDLLTTGFEMPGEPLPPWTKMPLPGNSRYRYGDSKMELAKRRIQENSSIGLWLRDKQWGKMAFSGTYERFDGAWHYGLNIRFEAARTSDMFANQCRTISFASALRPHHSYSWMKADGIKALG